MVVETRFIASLLFSTIHHLFISRFIASPSNWKNKETRSIGSLCFLFPLYNNIRKISTRRIRHIKADLSGLFI